MKIIPKRKWRHLCFFLFSFFVLTNISAQTAKATISGKVMDEAGSPLVGVSIAEKGTANGSMTNLDGIFTLSVNKGATLIVSYLGFQDQEIKVGDQTNYVITLKEDKQLLEEVVVIGYGSVKKKDLTGAVSAIGEKDFAKGVVTSPAQLIAGKVPGVQITPNSGSPGAGNRIRIRGGASLNASNNPLIVIDGVPIGQEGKLSGSGDPLSLINPNDIESMNILKDASATAIYGSRASNGVILITTKKGSGKKMSIQVNSQNSIAHVARKIEVLSADQYRNFASTYGTPDQIVNQMAKLGSASTNWQDEIYRTAFTTDNNISFNGTAGILPYYISAGYMNQDGILKTDNLQRTTLSANLSPKFFDDHLSVNLNLKGSYAHQRFANKDAIGAAVRMDPTQPVKDEGFESFNDYWTWVSKSTDGVPFPDSNATKNPLALLESKNDKANVLKSIGNLQLDYKFHFLPELRANLNLGYDIAQGKGNVVVNPWGPSDYTSYSYLENGKTIYDGGTRTKYNQKQQNLLLEYYMNYNKNIESIASAIDVMAGYSYQDWKTTDKNFESYNYSRSKVTGTPSFPRKVEQYTLISYFGRMNYTLMDRYLLTASVRRDGSSRFGKDNRWGTFPSAAVAWRLNEESFMKGFSNLYNLKIRFGVGQTGQNEIKSNYGYLAKYAQSENTAYIQFGDHYHPMWRPDGYDANRKWESTTTYNAGVDYGFFGNRIYGSVDVYLKKTKDLLNEVYVASGENFTDRIIKNIGKMENKGVELSVVFVPVDNKDLTWDFGFNTTYNHSRITKLDNTGGEVGYLVGGINGGTGSTIQIQSVGYAPNSFYVYKQLYDTNGKPIDGAYADLNGDGIINEEDKYHYKQPEAQWFLGFNTNVRFQQWTLGTSLRANLGNYVYNNVDSSAGNISEALQSAYLANAPVNVLHTLFNQQNLFSDYYVQNASFLKMDYISLGYDFQKLLKTNKLGLRASFTVQNVFTITKYKGLDPEVMNNSADIGIDNNFYPNPRMFTLGLNLNF